ncbi:hypothetical protein EDC04DRAFT_2603276 [Pisolithus marmoratus]|nr:hypothetical protein EDC04DRAFT_2603276 [Pisolithus marmoratus]
MDPFCKGFELVVPSSWGLAFHDGDGVAAVAETDHADQEGASFRGEVCSVKGSGVFGWVGGVVGWGQGVLCCTEGFGGVMGIVALAISAVRGGEMGVPTCVQGCAVWTSLSLIWVRSMVLMWAMLKEWGVASMLCHLHLTHAWWCAAALENSSQDKSSSFVTRLLAWAVASGTKEWRLSLVCKRLVNSYLGRDDDGSLPVTLIGLGGAILVFPKPNIKAFVNWPNWGVIIHRNPEELVGHWWASLGVEPLPQDLEVPEREKSWSNDVPVIGEGPQGVAKSIDKGKGKGIVMQLSSGGIHVCGQGHLPVVGPPQVVTVAHPLSAPPLQYPVHSWTLKPPTPCKPHEKGSYMAQALCLHPSNASKHCPQQGWNIGNHVLHLMQLVLKQGGGIGVTVQEREMNIMHDMMEYMCTYIVHGTGGSTDEHPTILSVPSPALPSPTNILCIPEPVPQSTPSTPPISSTIAATSQDYSINANQVCGNLQPADVGPMMEPISENTVWFIPKLLRAIGVD